MRHGRRDSTHAAIRDGLRRVIGNDNVVDTADFGHDFPDLVVGHKGQTFMLEVKGPKTKLSPGQSTFQQAWRGHYVVVRTLAEAFHAIGIDVLMIGAP